MDRNILLTVEYDGSGFHGWQYQPGLRTVQGELERALSDVLSEDVSVNGTSRTDAGVHALGQCLSFTTSNPIPTENMMKALNNALSKGKTIAGSIPGDIRVLECREMPKDFHARFDCKGKTYKYMLSLARPDAFSGNYYYFINGSLRESDESSKTESNKALDIDAMKEACEFIVGTHDFVCFQASGGTPRETTVRTITELSIEPGDEQRDLPSAGGFSTNSKSNGTIVIRVTGDGFLYNMVRIIVGTLVEVGQGRRTPESVRDAIEKKDRTLAGHTAPAEGLYLERIFFEQS